MVVGARQLEAYFRGAELAEAAGHGHGLPGGIQLVGHRRLLGLGAHAGAQPQLPAVQAQLLQARVAQPDNGRVGAGRYLKIVFQLPRHRMPAHVDAGVDLLVAQLLKPRHPPGPVLRVVAQKVVVVAGQLLFPGNRRGGLGAYQLHLKRVAPDGMGRIGGLFGVARHQGVGEAGVLEEQPSSRQPGAVAHLRGPLAVVWNEVEARRWGWLRGGQRGSRKQQAKDSSN